MRNILYAFAVTYKEHGKVRLEPYSNIYAAKLFGREGIMTPFSSYELDSDGLFTGEVILTRDFLIDRFTPMEKLVSYKKPVVSNGDLIQVRRSNIRYSHNDPRDSISLSFQVQDYMAFPNMVVIKNTDPTKSKWMGKEITCKVIAPLRPKSEDAKGYVIIADIDGGDKKWGFDNVYIDGRQQENYLPTGKEIFLGELSFSENKGNLYTRQHCSMYELNLDDLTKAFHSISKARKIILLDRNGNADNIDIYKLDKQGVEKIVSMEDKNSAKLKLNSLLVPSINPRELPVVIINQQKTELSDIVHDLGHPVFKLERNIQSSVKEY